MGRILVHEFTTLDGVIGPPTWAGEYEFAPRMGEAIGRIMGTCRAILLGRRTFEEFAPAWAGRSADDDPGAPFMNGTPKYVVSSTLRDPDWQNSTVLGPYSADRIRHLKEEVEGDLYVSGSGRLVRAMLADGLVDLLHLFVFPLVIGSGPTWFGDPATHGRRFGAAPAESYENGALHLALDCLA